MNGLTTGFRPYVLVYFILVLAQLDCATGADLKARKPTSKDVVGSWIAHDPCGVEFVKIVFRTNQTAVAAFCFANERVDVVTLKWELTGYKINCKTLDRPESAPADFELTWGACYIRSTVTYSNNAKRSYDLLKESYVFEQLQRANEALAAISEK
jgi:hypothetical protein